MQHGGVDAVHQLQTLTHGLCVHGAEQGGRRDLRKSMHQKIEKNKNEKKNIHFVRVVVLDLGYPSKRPLLGNTLHYQTSNHCCQGGHADLLL